MGKDFRNFGLIGGALALTVMSATPALAERVVMLPTIPWNINYAEDSCQLRRIFAHEGREAYLYINQYEPGDDGIEVMVGTADFRNRHEPRPGERGRFGRQDIEVRAKWEPDDRAAEINIRSFIDWGEAGTGIILLGNLKRDGFRNEVRKDDAEEGASSEEDPAWSAQERDARESELEGFLLENVFSDDLYLETGPLHDAMNAMRTCTDELIEHWGFDAEEQRNLSRRAVPDEQDEWARSIGRNYPASQIVRGGQAYIRTFLNISSDGRVTGCRLLNDFNDSEFEKTNCDGLMEYARYTPALDEQGNPIDSYDIMVTVYRLG